jgi:hypothetical protein
MIKFNSRIYCREVGVVFSLGLYLKKHHYGIIVYNDLTIRIMLGKYHYLTKGIAKKNA